MKETHPDSELFGQIIMAKRNHTVEVVETNLEIKEELHLHEKGWIAQRAGWIFIYLLVTLAAFGMFGDGMLSHQNQTVGNTQIQYERFHRQEARMNLRFDIQQQQSNLVISFDNDYLRNFKVESVMPEPQEVKISNEQVNYVFDSEGKTNIVFYLVPQELGNIRGSVQVNDNQFNLSHFIFP